MSETSVLPHQYNFRRERGKGSFWQQSLTFFLTDARSGKPVGELALARRTVTFTDAAQRADFRLRQSFWGQKWFFENNDDQLFGQFRLGWTPSFQFADGSEYQIKIKRHWRLRKRLEGEANVSATFIRDGHMAMELRNTAPSGLFFNELRSPMEGPIFSNITDIRVIAGLLLGFQTVIDRRHRAAH